MPNEDALRPARRSKGRAVGEVRCGLARAVASSAVPAVPSPGVGPVAAAATSVVVPWLATPRVEPLVAYSVAAERAEVGALGL